jgi:hypothetical protein
MGLDTTAWYTDMGPGVEPKMNPEFNEEVPT